MEATAQPTELSWQRIKPPSDPVSGPNHQCKGEQNKLENTLGCSRPHLEGTGIPEGASASRGGIGWNEAITVIQSPKGLVPLQELPHMGQGGPLGALDPSSWSALPPGIPVCHQRRLGT